MYDSGNILIIEDDEGIATLEARKVRALGHEAYVASNIKEALSILSTNKFDAIIIDYNIGESLSGVEFYLSLKERGIFLPAILVTGLEDPNLLLKAIRAGIRDFVPKIDNFLDDLGPALTRAIRQSKAEKEFLVTSLLREKNQILESVIAAAKVCSTRILVNSESLDKWLGDLKGVFGIDGDEYQLNTRSDLFNMIAIDDRNLVKEAVSCAESKCEDFKLYARLEFDINRWLLVQGKCFARESENNLEQTLVLVFSDITEIKNLENELTQSNSRLAAMNKRLQVGATEANHRIKNSLQNISSLLNIYVNNSGNLSQEEAKKLATHIQGLAKMHDILTHSYNDFEDSDNNKIPVAAIINEIVFNIQAAMPHRHITSRIAPIELTSKRTCTISVIVNELLSNAIKHGSGPIELDLIKDDEENATLVVTNHNSQFPDDLSEKSLSRNGLSIIEALSTGDLGTKPEYRNTPPDKAEAIIKFAL